MCALMLFAGHETTTTTITSAVLMLLRNPDQLELLRADPDEVAGPAVEEALRFDGRDQGPASASSTRTSSCAAARSRRASGSSSCPPRRTAIPSASRTPSAWT